MGVDARTPTRQPPLRLSTPLLMLWSLSQPARSDRDPPRMPRADRILATVTLFMLGAAVAMIVCVITPGANDRIVGWMIIGGAVGMLTGVPLWIAIWKRQQDPRRQ